MMREREKKRGLMSKKRFSGNFGVETFENLVGKKFFLYSQDSAPGHGFWYPRMESVVLSFSFFCPLSFASLSPLSSRGLSDTTYDTVRALTRIMMLTLTSLDDSYCNSEVSPFALCLTFFLELKCTKSTSVRLTLWEVLYKYLNTIQYNTTYSNNCSQFSFSLSNSYCLTWWIAYQVSFGKVCCPSRNYFMGICTIPWGRKKCTWCTDMHMHVMLLYYIPTVLS